MLTKQEMCDKLQSIGLKRRYKPYNDEANGERSHDSQIILLETRRPVKIVDGELHGCEMDVYDDSTIRVWTSQKQKAKAIATKNGFKVRLLDGEAELYILTDRADEFLHGLGARVRTTLSPERLARLAAIRASITPEQREANLVAMQAARRTRKSELAS